MKREKMSFSDSTVLSLANDSENISIGESRNGENGVFPTVNQRLGEKLYAAVLCS